jgi:hypothetical protein
MAENLPEARQISPLLGISSTDIPLQGADFPSKPAAAEGAGHLVPGVTGPRSVKKKPYLDTLSGSLKRQELEKAKEKMGAAYNQQLLARPSREIPPPKLLRGIGRRAEPHRSGQNTKRPRDSKGPGTYKEVLANIKVAIFRVTYPIDKLTEDDQNYILEVLGEVLRRTKIGEIPHLKSYRLEGGALI